jgi:hypothetical protein
MALLANQTCDDPFVYGNTIQEIAMIQKTLQMQAFDDNEVIRFHISIELPGAEVDCCQNRIEPDTYPALS